MSLEVDFLKTIPTAEGPVQLSVQFKLEKGQTLALTGASGSGKTTLLRILAGLGQPDAGRIHFEGKTWLDSAKKDFLPPAKRSIGMVFQDYALFPNMTLAQNLRFAKDDPALMTKLLEKLGLQSLQDRKPRQLSGGQQQRAALARALMRSPELLLLDEALAALGQAERNELQQFLLELQAEMGFAAVLVSHDLGEIYKLANQVAVLNAEGFKWTKQAFATSNILEGPSWLLKVLAKEDGYVLLEWQGKLHRIAQKDRFPEDLQAGDWIEMPMDGPARKIAPPF